MSPRRQDSEETLFDGSSNGTSGFDKLDCMPLDPFLIVQPSLNDSLLVKQGLVDITAQPPPTHNAHDIQGPPPLVCRRDDTSSRTRSYSDTSSIPRRPKSQPRGSLSGDTPSKGGRMKRDKKCGESRATDVVPLPPAAYTPLPVGQGRHTG